MRRYRPRMSWDLDAAEARELAEEYLAAWVPPRDDLLGGDRR
jgi:hypothetical protein